MIIKMKCSQETRRTVEKMLDVASGRHYGPGSGRSGALQGGARLQWIKEQGAVRLAVLSQPWQWGVSSHR